MQALRPCSFTGLSLELRGCADHKTSKKTSLLSKVRELVIFDTCKTTRYSYPSGVSSTFDHRTLKTRLPVRSALFKQRTGGLVVRWVTTGESPLLNVFDCALFFAPVT
jgi:hypothetical protein